MKLNIENDNYYIEKLNELINESSNIGSLMSVKNVKIKNTNLKEKGCCERLCELLFCSCCEDKDEEDKLDYFHFVGLKNFGNNCYLNAGLQILSRCYPLLKELLKSNYEKDQLMKLLVRTMKELLFGTEKFYNPNTFIECFCKRNPEFVIGQQSCSQEFIRTILRNINNSFERNIIYNKFKPEENSEELKAYESFIDKTKIFPETKAYSIFSGILKIQISGECSKCSTEINNYSFNSFVDHILYLNSITKKTKFSDLLRKNMAQKNRTSIKCPNCNEKIQANSFSKFVKIPEIFIFTLERFLVRNRTPIVPDEFINIYEFVDDSSKISNNKCNYELFAVNIRLGDDLSFGHEICHVKEKNEWFTINDRQSYKKGEEYLENSYGLFYRRIKNEQ